MTSDKGILIKNIYYMLTYAFRVLNQSNYEQMKSEEFENILELFTEIITKGISKQLKQGLHREYILQQDNLSVIRGKLKISESIKNVLHRKQMLYCEYDELSVNNIYNQILKTTGELLLKQKEINETRRHALKKVLLYLQDVDTIDHATINWNVLKFHRNNQTYKMLLNLCYFVMKGLLLTTDKGEYKMATFLDDQSMSRLYERFILEYYIRHHSELTPTSATIDWAVDDGMIEFLPRMQSDIMLTNKKNGKILIIDAKYYAKSMQERVEYDSITVHSGNLYQIFTYVKNHSQHVKEEVSGMLLYARTEQEITPDFDYVMSGSKISVKSLDLNKEFSLIADQLERIIDYLN